MGFNANWNIELAKELAKAEGFELDDYQICIIEIVRAYYIEYSIYPAARVLRKQIVNHLGEDKTMYSIFPDTSNSEIAKYAGVPAPTGCF